MFIKSHTWRTPSARYSLAVARAVSAPHLLVGGTTGAGKSVLLDEVTTYLLTVGFSHLVLIDPKETQLQKYADVPQAVTHATTPQGIESTLQRCADLMDERFSRMRSQKVTETTETPVYIIIDEWIDIKYQCGRGARDALVRIIAKGRAAHIHVILATQRPTRDILDGAIRANFPAVVALRCANAQESRNLIGTAGAESLPKHGEAFLLDADGLNKFRIDYDPEKVERIVDHWREQLAGVSRWRWKRCTEC